MKISVFCLFLTAISAAKLPSSFKKCKSSDKKCLSESAFEALHQLNKPFKEVNLPSLEPLQVPSLTINAGNGPVGLQQNFKNVKIYGFSTPATTEFEFDLDKKTARLACNFEELRLVADYNINGKILLLPVFGNGSAVVTMVKPFGEIHFTLDEYQKKGKKFLKALTGNLIIEPKLVKFDFQNLFNGDKTLGDNVLQVVNDNWREVFGDIKSSYEDAFGQIITGLFNNLLSKVPLSDLLE